MRVPPPRASETRLDVCHDRRPTPLDPTHLDRPRTSTQTKPRAHLTNDPAGCAEVQPGRRTPLVNTSPSSLLNRPLMSARSGRVAECRPRRHQADLVILDPEGPVAGGPMPSGNGIRDAQRATWAGLSAGWEKWDSVIMDQLRPVGTAIIECLD